jgi:cytochrome oxidase Cu insertion factor (SCO1/SenC/PrrC family)
VKFRRIIHFILSGIFFFLFTFSCGDEYYNSRNSSLAEFEIRGKFSSAEENSSKVEVFLWGAGTKVAPEISSNLGKTFTFDIQASELDLMRRKKIFKGKVQETLRPSAGKAYLLHYLWPDERGDRIRFDNVNRLLRRDTLSLGDGSIRSVGDQLPPFALYDQDGEIITTDYFDGSVTVLNFIFTRCSVPEMCPASTMKMKKLQALAAKTKIENVKFLSITLDPFYDSPAVLKQYAQAYGVNEESFRFGTADKGVIDDLTRQFGLLRKNDESLTIDHTMRTLMINFRRQIIYQVPGKDWSVEDFLSRLSGGLQK